MKRKKVTSREYKLMLRPVRFPGDEPALLKAAAALWRDLSRTVADIALDTDGRLDQVHTRRLIRFHDTPRQDLNRAGYIYRERRDLATDDGEFTLKFRHPDRYVAQHRDMTPVTTKGARTKFEEDIKIPFVSLYSFSTTVPASSTKAFPVPVELFPGIREQIEGEGFRRDSAFSVVNGFTALERVITGASLRIGRTPAVRAECALIVWHDHDRRRAKPVAVELSYRYGDKKERYGGIAARRAFDVFQAIQTKLTSWVAPDASTKTALVYE